MNALMGNRIRELRKKRGWTQEELASQLNERFDVSINKSMISKWENGKGDPYLSYAKYLAYHFSVSLDYLVGLSNEHRFLFYFDGWEEKQAAKKQFAKKQHELNALFDQLNDAGQDKAIIYIDDLVASNRYSPNETNSQLLNAAHSRTDIDIEEGSDTNEDNIMDEKDF